MAEDMSPGSPRWYLRRLTERLLSRQYRYRMLENYALGYHPYPNGDRKFVAALADLQRKAKTNYIPLVINAVTTRMRKEAFVFGDEEDQYDEDAERIWAYNNMDLQASMIIKMGATFGDTYVLVSPPDPEDPAGEPIITAEDPKCCITETNPANPTKTLAGLKLYQDNVDGLIYGILYLPEAVYVYTSPAPSNDTGVDTASLTKYLNSQPSEGGFKLFEVLPNPAGKVTLVRGNWQPAFGTMGRGEAEDVFTIQDRINHTVLDRLVISKSQAYNQRWMTGGAPNRAGGDQPKFNAAADAVWVNLDSEGKFGEFTAADLTQVLQAIKDDVGDLAAISETPASFLMNRIANVSGDTLTQDQSALVAKVKIRMESMGWMFTEVMKMAFLLKGDTTKATAPEAKMIWKDPEVGALSEKADALGKLVAAGVPLEIAMRELGYNQKDINLAVAKQEEQQKLDQQNMLVQQEHEMTLAKTTGAAKASGAKKTGSSAKTAKPK